MWVFLLIFFKCPVQSFLNINTLYLLVLPNKWVRHVVPYLSAERQPCFIYSGSTCGYLLHHLYVGSLFVYMSLWWKDAMILIFPVDSSSRVSCPLHSSSISKWQQSSLQSKESLFSNTLYFCYNWNISNMYSQISCIAGWFWKHKALLGLYISCRVFSYLEVIAGLGMVLGFQQKSAI